MRSPRWILAFAVGLLSSGDEKLAASPTFSQTGRAIGGRLGPSPSDEVLRSSCLEGDTTVSEGTPGDLGPTDRIIRIAALAIEVPDGGAFDRTWDRAVGIASRFGGSVLSTSRSGAGDASKEGSLSGELSIRVPAEKFEGALLALRKLGDVRADSTSSQDVTEECVDLNSRLRHLRAQEEALLALMRRARSIQDTLVVQRELAKAQEEIERITGRLNFLNARTESSTISLQLAEPGAFAEIRVTTQRSGPSFAKAWETAVEGLERMATTSMIAMVWAAPFLLVGVLGFWVYRSRKPAAEM